MSDDATTTTTTTTTASNKPAAKLPKPSRFIEAAKKGYDDTLKEIYENPKKDINVNKVDGLGQTAMHWAARGGHLSTVKLLLSWGGDANAKDKRGETPLHKAAYGCYPEVCSALIEGGASVDEKSAEGRQPIDLTEDRLTKCALFPPEYVDLPDTVFDSDSD